MDLIPRDKRVVEHNDFINARYDFPVIVHRLFVAGLLLIDKDDEDLKTYRIPVRDLLDAFDIKSGAYYDELKRRWPELTKQATLTFEKVGKNGKRRLGMKPLFASLEYQEGEGCIELKFNPDLRPQLLDFKSNFTQYRLSDVKEFGSQYSFRIYRWLKQVEDLRPDRTFSIEDLREMLMLEGKYADFGSFRVNVLDVARRELDEHADISFDYELRRKGRKVTDVVFQIRLSERTRHGMGPLFENALAPPPSGPQPDDLDDFDHWFNGLAEEERERHEVEAERRMQDLPATGRVRDAERWRHLRAIYAEWKEGAT